MANESMPNPEDIESYAIDVVDMFDQANTNHIIEELGSKGEILFDSVNALRKVLNVREIKTILTEEQVSR